MEADRPLKETTLSQTKRECLKNYAPLSHKIKDTILSMYSQNPNIKPQEIYQIESNLGLKRNKIIHFLNYEKKKLLKLQYPKGSYKIFSKQDRSILEKKFNKNSDLSKEGLSKLKKRLSEHSSKKIRNWFDYRKRKMKLIELQKKNNQFQEEENILVSSHSNTEINTNINHFQNNTNNCHNLNRGLEMNDNYKNWLNGQLNMMKYRTQGQFFIPQMYYVNQLYMFGNYTFYYL